MNPYFQTAVTSKRMIIHRELCSNNFRKSVAFFVHTVVVTESLKSPCGWQPPGDGPPQGIEHEGALA
jgi:hypothetical protein